MARFSALLDACVLVPIGLADVLMRLAEAGLYRPLWSERILDEMVWAVETVHPDLADGRARNRARRMKSAFDDACVADWQDLVASIDLPDPDDRHVVAAALRGRADLIVTANLKDFPADTLGRFGLEVQGPDDFLLDQLDLDPGLVIGVLRQQADAAANPAITFDRLLGQLARAGVPRFTEAAHSQQWRA